MFAIGIVDDNIWDSIHFKDWKQRLTREKENLEDEWMKESKNVKFILFAHPRGH